MKLTIDTKKAVFYSEFIYFSDYKQEINAQQRDPLTRHSFLCMQSRLGRPASNKNPLDNALILPQTDRKSVV